MIRTSLSQIASSVFLLFAAHLAVAQNGHLNAGATSHTQNSQLLWANGVIFTAESGYVQGMSLATSGRYAGLYNSGPTLTALSSSEGGSALGSFLAAEIVSLTGPAGGVFSFWEGIDQGGGISPTFSISSGTLGGSYRFALSDASLSAGFPEQDAFGHLHGRRFTVNQEGQYTLGIRVLDTSVNGAGGGPIHTPSEVLYMNFATVPEPSVFALAGVGALAWRLVRRRKKI